MKRINILLIAIICLLSTSCSKMTFEEKAVSRVGVIVDKMEREGNLVSAELLDQRTIYSGDSICVINFNVRVTEKSGREGVLKMEYVLFWTDKQTLYSLAYPIDKKGKNLLEDLYNMHSGKLPSDKYEYERLLRSLITIYSYFGPNMIRDIHVPED